MKKIICFVLAFVLLLGLCACGGEGGVELPAIFTPKAKLLYDEAAELYYVQENYAAAYEMLSAEELADYGPAMLLLGDLYDDGDVVERDYNKAAELYAASAEKGVPLAKEALAGMYLVGNGVERNKDKAMELYAQFVTEAEAQLAKDEASYDKARIYSNLAYCYADGRGTEIDFDKANEYLEAMLQCEPVGASRLYSAADIYKNGSYGTVDADKAEELCIRALPGLTEKAENGNAGAQVTLGYYYKAGLGGVEQDYTKALKYYELAASRGWADAMSNAGMLYRDGKGVEQDYAKALEYFEQAARRNDANGYFQQAWMYENGMGVPIDYLEAGRLYLRAVSLGHPSAFEMVINNRNIFDAMVEAGDIRIEK